MKNSSQYRLSRTWARTDSVHNIAISPDGRYLACSSNDYKLSIYDLSVGMLLREYTVMDHAVGLAWGDGGGQLFVACLKGEVFLYQGVTRSRFVAYIFSWLPRSTPIAELANLRAIVRDIAYDPAARRLFVSHEQRVSVLDRSTDTTWTPRLLPVAFIRYIWQQKGRNFDLTSVIVPRPVPGSHSSTSKVYVVDMSYGIHLYDVDNESAVEKWDISGRRSGGAGLSPDGRYMACWSLCSNIYVYDLEQQKCVQTIDVQEIVNDYDNVELYLQYIHNGRDLIVGSNHGRPCIISLSEGTVVDELLHCATNALVPYVAYTSYKGMDIIITADTGRGEETKVKMWRRGGTQWTPASGFVQSLVGLLSKGFQILWALLVQLILLFLCLMGVVMFYYAYLTVSHYTVGSSNGLGRGLVDDARSRLVGVGKSLSERYNGAGLEGRGLDDVHENLQSIYYGILNQATTQNERRPAGQGPAIVVKPHLDNVKPIDPRPETVVATADVLKGGSHSFLRSGDYGRQPAASEGGTSEGIEVQLGWDVGGQGDETPQGTEAPTQGWAIVRFAGGVWEGMRA